MTKLKALIVLVGLIFGIGVYWGLGSLFAKPPLKPWLHKPAACSSGYSHLHVKKRPIEMRIVFGYKDARPARFVGDRYERQLILQSLSDLGFDRDKADDDKFLWSKKFGGETHQINLTLAHSSVGPDDAENRKNPLQKWRSRYAEDIFTEALKESDVAIYVGHSRSGGGPDFAPPVCLKNNKIDFSWYRKHQPGLNKMLTALKDKNKDPKIVGLLSCASSQHFSKAIQKAAPTTKIISSTVLLYYMDSLKNLTEFLQKVASPPCDKNS